MSKFDAVSKVWSGPKEDRSETLSFRESILKSFRRTPEKYFQVSDSEGTKLTYSQLELISVRIAQNLRRFGVQPKDVVLAHLYNSTYAAPTFLGCALLGAPINILNRTLLTDVEWIRYTLRTMDPKIIIIDESVKYAATVIQVMEEMNLDCKIFFTNDRDKMFGENLFDFCELLMETKNEKSFR